MGQSPLTSGQRKYLASFEYWLYNVWAVDGDDLLDEQQAEKITRDKTLAFNEMMNEPQPKAAIDTDEVAGPACIVCGQASIEIICVKCRERKTA